jgi:hypothetical protein
MDAHHPRARRAAFLVPLIAWIVVAGFIAPVSGTIAAQLSELESWANAFPTAIDHDLAAMALPPEAFPTPGLVTTWGHMLRPIEEGTAFAPVLGMEPLDIARDLRETGWVTRYVGEVGRSRPGEDSPFPVTGWTSIAEHEDAVGAMAGFDLLDESGFAGVEVVQAPAVGDASRLTKYVGTDSEGRDFTRVRYTFVRDRLIGSVALYWYDDAQSEAVAPEAMVDTAERLLERMTAVVAGESPGMSGRVVRMNAVPGTDVVGHEEGYYVLDAGVVARYGDTLEAIGNALQFRDRWGIEAQYLLELSFTPPSGAEHRPYWQVSLIETGSEADASGLVGAHMEYDEILGYDTMTELDELPAVDGAVAGVTYAVAWGDGSENVGYRIWVQSGSTVVIVEASGPDGVELPLMFNLVDAQLACLETGACAPIPLPFGVPVGPATPGV